MLAYMALAHANELQSHVSEVLPFVFVSCEANNAEIRAANISI